MAWYLQLALFTAGLIISFVSLWWVDFNKFTRVGKKEFAIFLYIALSLALGYLIGKLFIEVGLLFPTL